MIPTDYTAAERQAYINGALGVCVRLKVADEVVTEFCAELGIKPEELLELRSMAKNRGVKAAEPRPEPPFFGPTGAAQPTLDGALRAQPGGLKTGGEA
jgi:hypothetical protein